MKNVLVATMLLLALPAAAHATTCDQWGTVAEVLAEARDHGTTEANLSQGLQDDTWRGGLPEANLSRNLRLVHDVYTVLSVIEPRDINIAVTLKCVQHHWR
jgi:hypothetical protein